MTLDVPSAVVDDVAARLDETDSEVAEKLGVSQQLVSKVVNRSNDTIIDHDRVKARLGGVL